MYVWSRTYTLQCRTQPSTTSVSTGIVIRQDAISARAVRALARERPASAPKAMAVGVLGGRRVAVLDGSWSEGTTDDHPTALGERPRCESSARLCRIRLQVQQRETVGNPLPRVFHLASVRACAEEHRVAMPSWPMTLAHDKVLMHHPVAPHICKEGSRNFPVSVQHEVRIQGGAPVGRVLQFAQPVLHKCQQTGRRGEARRRIVTLPEPSSAVALNMLPPS